MQKTRAKNLKKDSSLGDSLLGELLQKSPSATSKVGAQLVTFQPGQVESLAKDLEITGKNEKEEDGSGEGKRRRPEGDTPPDHKRNSKMPTLRKDVGGSKLLHPGNIPSLIN